MIYSNILKQANLHRGQKIDEVLGKWFINEGLQTLATQYDTACKRLDTTLTCPAGEWVDLPVSAIRVLECVQSGTATPYDAYEASYGQLRAESDVVLDITYLRAPLDVVADSDTPDTHELYHKPLALFMAARDRQRVYADEERDAMRLLNEFNTMATLANARLGSLKGTRRVMKVGAFK